MEKKHVLGFFSPFLDSLTQAYLYGKCHEKNQKDGVFSMSNSSIETKKERRKREMRKKKRGKKKENEIFFLIIQKRLKNENMFHAPHSSKLNLLLQCEERNLQKVSLRRHCAGSLLLNDFLDEQEACSYHEEVARLRATTSSNSDRGSAHPKANVDVMSLASLGYPRYTVNVQGQVWDTENQKYLSTKPRAPDGVCRAHVYNDTGKRVCRYVHDLVARAFLGVPPEQLNACGRVVQPVVAHLNGDKSDNRLANLAWMNKNDGRPRTMASSTLHAATVKRAAPPQKNGLFRAVTWSVRCTKSNMLPDWIPVFTWFNFDEADLVRDLGMDEDSQNELRSVFHKAKDGQSPIVQLQCDRFELEVDDCERQYFPKQHWKTIALENCRPVQISLGGLVRECGVNKGPGPGAGGGKCFTSIGSGQTSREDGFKVYYAHPTCAVGGKAWPEMPVDKLVLEAWLGRQYWKPFVGEEVQEDDVKSYEIVHLDGNPRNSHLFNLAVVRVRQPCSGPCSTVVFDEEWAHCVYTVYCRHKDLIAASKQQQARKGFKHLDPGHVLELFERKAGVFSPR